MLHQNDTHFLTTYLTLEEEDASSVISDNKHISQLCLAFTHFKMLIHQLTFQLLPVQTLELSPVLLLQSKCQLFPPIPYHKIFQLQSSLTLMPTGICTASISHSSTSISTSFRASSPIEIPSAFIASTSTDASSTFTCYTSNVS